MDVKFQSKRSYKAPRSGRTKVKSGCRTCKIRKIKCDEGRPACHRCVSTGRVCDGYGIWGGGGKAYSQRSSGPKDCTGVLRVLTIPDLVNLARVTTAEKGYMEWFMYLTVKKLPGVFKSTFWDSLVCQACSTEPAVLHAVLALSSAHKTEGVNINSGLHSREETSDQRELFTLQQYSSAINHLQHHFSAKTKASVRVVLVTCLVFIHLECLRGHYQAANGHLQYGLKLIEEIQACSALVGDEMAILKPSGNFVDDSIIEAFARLHLQAALLGQVSGILYLVVPGSNPESPTIMFQSVNQARRHLDRLLTIILNLNKQCLREGTSQGVRSLPELLDRQQGIKAKLGSWLEIYNASTIDLRCQRVTQDTLAYQLLHAYYTMAEIMADASLWPACESIFDSHTQRFVFILEQSIDIGKFALSNPVSDILLNRDCWEMSKSISDIGIISPLYYTALKCRNHRVRLQAIRLLEVVPHKEGFWDTVIAACTAREVMRIEEGDFFKEIPKVDHFSLYSIPTEQDLLLPALPNSDRLHNVQVVLPDNASGNIALMCTRKSKRGSWEVIKREYNVASQCWVD